MTLAVVACIICSESIFEVVRVGVYDAPPAKIPDRSRAFTSNTWEALARRAYQMHITGAPAELDLDWRKKVYVGAGAGMIWLCVFFFWREGGEQKSFHNLAFHLFCGGTRIPA